MQKMKPRYLILALFLILLVAYPLSMGPVSRIQTMRHPGEAPPRWFFALYYPILRAAKPFPEANDIIQWYIDLWVVKSDRH